MVILTNQNAFEFTQYSPNSSWVKKHQISATLHDPRLQNMMMYLPLTEKQGGEILFSSSLICDKNNIYIIIAVIYTFFSLPEIKLYIISFI